MKYIHINTKSVRIMGNFNLDINETYSTVFKKVKNLSRRHL